MVGNFGSPSASGGFIYAPSEQQGELVTVALQEEAVTVAPALVVQAKLEVTT